MSKINPFELEEHLITIPPEVWEELRGPFSTGIGWHEKTGLFVLTTAGQGPVLVWAEKDDPATVEGKSPFEALDHVKKLRAGWQACNGALYKNNAVSMMQEFLEKCVEAWGTKFMDCVIRERTEEEVTKDYMERCYGDKGRRELVFPECVE